MNNAKLFIKSTLILGLLLALSSCSVTQNTTSTENRERDPYMNKRVVEITDPIRLEDFLYRASNVAIRGNQVSIRGGGPPLFIIDNVPVGYSFLNVKASVNPLDIASVEVLSGPDTVIYGRRGANGVIIIRTKTF